MNGEPLPPGLRTKNILYQDVDPWIREAGMAAGAAVGGDSAPPR